MNKLLMLLLCFVLLTVSAMGQHGFKITGNIEGIPDGYLLLVINGDRGQIDTLGQVITSNGSFEFTGAVNEITVGFIMTPDQKGVIVLMLENADFRVSYGPRGAEITGGKAQDLFNRYTNLNKSIEDEQERLKAQFSSQQEGSKMNPQILQQQFMKYVKKIKEEELALIKAYNDDYVTAYVIATGMRQTSQEDLMARYELLGENARRTPYGRMISSLVTQIEQLSIGHTLSNFTVRRPDGNPISLNDLNGKVKIVDFWASWCAPCRQKNAEMIKLYKNYGSKGLDVLSVSLDDNYNAWVKAIDEDGLPWKQGSDLLGQRSPLTQLFLIQSIPLVFVLDKDNHIVGKNMSTKELKNKIEELLK